MPRSEYYEPALLPGEKEQPQIIIDAVELYDLLVRAEMMMTKVDRIRYGNRAVAQIQDVIKEFMLAYDCSFGSYISTLMLPQEAFTMR